MIIIPSKILLLGVFSIEILWILVAQTLGSSILLMPCLVCFLAIAVWSAVRGMALPFLLLFLPYSTLIKIRPESISFYTISLLIVLLVYTVKGIKNIKTTHLIPGLAIIALTLCMKTIYGYQIENSYILFAISLLLIPFIKREFMEKYDFFWLTVFFSYGVVSASLLARSLVGFSNITRYYINIHELWGVVRYSGFYGDPNFYSAHIATAIGGVLVLLLNKTTKIRFVNLAITVAALIFCGFMSVSKSFLLIFIAEIILWIIAYMFLRGKITAKITMLFTVVILVAFLLISTAFTEMIDMMIMRLSLDKTLSDFTTGRLELWISYLFAFIQEPRLLIFGNGLTKTLIGGRASHNTIIQCVYHFGLVGTVVFISWMICYIRTLLSDMKIKWKYLIQIGILVIGAIGPWMGLDMVFFDEFFLFPLYVCAGIVCMVQSDES